MNQNDSEWKKLAQIEYFLKIPYYRPMLDLNVPREDNSLFPLSGIFSRNAERVR